ncbi:MAG: 4Fe-4S dicluster domain-containing protein, partial [Spirochaetia bacterium]|nr:4Fe-4S dicluster domain-containing protein [Spirochaetia bacterium]
MSHDIKRNLIDELLAEQKTLTAVDLFSKRHEEGSLPKQAKYYRDLIPLEKPKSGEQFAFAVDLDACTGCKACVSACHSLNGLGYEETWRDVGLLIGGSSTQPVQQTVTTACHHCLNPACLSGCPVDAYEKDATTGIVRHLDDQCIGCQYCTLTCPYEVPKYSKKHGIVRKCDMCTNRLAVGEAPACVQACPNSAIRIEIVNQDQVARTSTADARLVAGAVDSDYTQPSTRYRTKKIFPENMAPADRHHLEPEESHWPVVLMLALKQASVGAFALSFFYGTPLKLVLTLATALLGIVIGTFHLGRPMYAWRAVVGLGHSWLSREIVIFGLYAGLAMAFVGADWLPQLKP